MKKNRISALILVCFILMTASFYSCSLDDFDDDESSQEQSFDTSGHQGDKDQTWAIYWYLCGSDLESDNAAASTDLVEMMEVRLPENVRVVIQTGGAREWHNEFVSPDRSQRFLYSSDGLELVDEQPLSNMGDPETLKDFLSFCNEKYPADKTAVLFWNHGGGSVSGAAFDEMFENDSLTLDEFDRAFNEVYGNQKEKKLEMACFDTCLMATIDNAYVFSKYANYLTASEEYEPGGGWLYSGWLQALADDPSMDGALLGKHICDTYYKGCVSDEVADEATLSVVDLNKIQPLLQAYEEMGTEALLYALDDTAFFSDFGREAFRSENYGGNTDEQGYSNMVDLGHLAENCKNILPKKSQAVIDGLKDCVIYKVNGPYRTKASGLSCYYSYNGDPDDLAYYKQEGCSDAFKYLFSYGIEGDIGEEGKKFVDGLGYDKDTIPEIPVLTDEDEDYPVDFDDEGNVVMQLDAETLSMLRSVKFCLSYVDEENDFMVLLGEDNDINADWENGVFKDNFRGVWGAVDGNLVYMEISFEGEDYTDYSVPILLNGEEYNLRVVYDYNKEEYRIIGARKGLDDSGMADKNLVMLKPGDEIIPIHYISSVSGDDDFTEIQLEPFTVTENTSFGEVSLGDGQFIMMFELEDTRNNTVFSQLIRFTVEGDNVTTEIFE